VLRTGLPPLRARAAAPGPGRPRAVAIPLLAFLLLAFLWMLTFATGARTQTWFDALVASVDGEPILASDVTLDDVLFGQGRTFATMDPAERDQVINRLIRRRLLLGEAERFGVARPTAAAVEAEVARVREHLGPKAEGIPPVALEARVREKLRADAFVDARIRAFVLIRDAQVGAAVAKRLQAPDAPDVRDPKAREALEREVRRELVRRETDQRLERYIKRLEERATIRRYPVPDPDF